MSADGTEQLVLEIPGWAPLAVTPTPAMRRREQGVYQCSWCGTVVVISSRAGGKLGACPVGHEQPTSWWKQLLPVAGLSIDPGSEERGEVAPDGGTAPHECDAAPITKHSHTPCGAELAGPV